MLFSIASVNLHAQRLSGTWIKVKTTAADGSDLYELDPLKYSYHRYEFSNKKSELSAFSSPSQSHMRPWSYEYKDSVLSVFIPGPFPFLIGSYQVESLTDTLMILKDLPDVVKPAQLYRYYFQCEQKFKDSYIVKPEDIHIAGTDTTYNTNAFLLPRFRGNGDYQTILRAGAPSVGADAKFEASFVVGKDGIADSIKITRSIGYSFDNAVIRNFKKNRSNWQAATYKGRPVVSRTLLRYTFLHPNTVTELSQIETKLQQSLNAGEYQRAWAYCDQLIKKAANPDAFFKRAIARYLCGDRPGALSDLQVVEQSGEWLVGGLIERFSR